MTSSVASRPLPARALPVPVLVALAVMVLASPLRAEPATEENCNDRNSTADIVQCLATQTAVWDRRLNTAFQNLVGSLPARRRDRLRTAQRLWIQYRDANCAYYASGEGTIRRVEATECMRSMTQIRAQELEAQN